MAKLPLFQTGLDINDVKFPAFIKKILNTQKSSLPSPFREEDVQNARGADLKALNSRMMQFVLGKKYPVRKVEQISIPSNGFEMKTDIYFPIDIDYPPIILYFHGGGYVVGSIKESEIHCRNICNHTQSIVVAPDYRLAPENKFPCAVEDAWNALNWVSNMSKETYGHSDSIFIMGDSAGGGLAAILGRDSHSKGYHNVKGQILLYPWVDQHISALSHKKYGEGYVLTNELVKFFTKCYQNSPNDINHPDFSPLVGNNLEDSVPALFFLASHDPIRDSGLSYAKKLHESGVPTLCKTYQPTVHGFAKVYRVLPKGKLIMADIFDSINTFQSSL